MKLLTGEFRNTLDEKGRVSLPVRLRNGLEGNTFVLTRGLDSCLWLFPLEAWDEFARKMTAVGSPFDQNARLVQRRLLAPAQEVEVDKLGRISIPQSIREYASLSSECTIVGMASYIEIWDSAAYSSYLDETESEFAAATAGFTDIRLGAGEK
ncbi:MAG: division/cell wall cluster transcriptional repressor MraZ [Rectinemataceae bacterium]|nr:division/cell wall cluster transcriptional repressor MraZ [Rectinemataceae bacterium]